MKVELCRFQNATILDNGKACMSNVNFYISEGDKIGVFGLHDSGKSLIAKALCGRLKVEGYTYYDEHFPKNGFYISDKSLLIPSLSVYENLYTICDNRKKEFIVRHKLLYEKAVDVLEHFNLSIEANTNVSNLNKVQNVIVQILRAFENGERFIVLDNVTQMWNEDELTQLNGFMPMLEGMTIVYICSKIDSILLKCDKVIVTKSRSIEAVVEGENITQRVLEHYAFGNFSSKVLPCSTTVPGKKVLELAFSYDGCSAEIAVCSGEVVGLFDINTFVGDSILNELKNGYIPYISIDGKECHDVCEYVSCGLGIIDMFNPASQLFDCFTREGNRSIQNIKKISSFGIINRQLEKYIERISNDYPGRCELIGEKYSDSLQTLLQRWWNANAKVLILNYAPAGYHPEDQQSINAFISRLKESGVGFLLLLSELSDGNSLCDRIAIIDKERKITYVQSANCR